jgi:hypothetical protein
MHELVIGVAVTVIGGLILWALAWLWRRRRVPLELPGWVRRRHARRATRKREAQVRRLRQAVIDRAGRLNVVIPLTWTGTSDRTIVRWRNGNQTHHYRDWATYGRDMQALRTPLESSYASRPETPVDRWSAERCRTWLAEHPCPAARLGGACARVRRLGNWRRNGQPAGE